MNELSTNSNNSNINSLKRKIILAAFKAKEGHIPSAFSVLDIIWVLYDRVMKIFPNDVQNIKRDYFILSKGHAALALYVVLAKKGFISIKELEDYASFESILGGHPDRNKVPGVEASTGSLGHGFPIAAGIAMGKKIQNNKNKIYVLIGDQECHEGTIWETILLASHHKLKNLICIIDYNHSSDRMLSVGDLSKKFQAFNWATQVIDGHDHNEIYNGLKAIDGITPTAIIAETIKGFGCKEMENNPAWHHRVPSENELNSILKDLS